MLNTLQEKVSGFNTDSNQVTIITRDQKMTKGEVKPKESVAKDIFDAILSELSLNTGKN